MSAALGSDAAVNDSVSQVEQEHARLLEILVAAGIAKHSAFVVVAVASAGKAYSAQIEAATGLRQPQVSVALNDLMERKWLTRQAVQREGRGRPIFIYRMRKGMTEVAEAAEKDLDRRRKALDKDREELKGAASKLNEKR